MQCDYVVPKSTQILVDFYQSQEKQFGYSGLFCPLESRLWYLVKISNFDQRSFLLMKPGIILRKFYHCTKAQKYIKIFEYKVLLEKVWLPNSEHQTVSYFPI
jgi:hypothetical protein